MDRTLIKVDGILKKCVKDCDTEMVSMVLFGSHASGKKSFLNEYEVLVLVENDIELENYIRFNNTVRLELLKARIDNVKILAFTPDVFESTLYKDRLVGTYLYIICRNNIILIDKNNTFASIHQRLCKNTVKSEEKFLEQCIDFARELGSEKWGHKWEKLLMQHRYLKKRKND